MQLLPPIGAGSAACRRHPDRRLLAVLQPVDHTVPALRVVCLSRADASDAAATGALGAAFRRHPELQLLASWRSCLADAGDALSYSRVASDLLQL